MQAAPQGLVRLADTGLGSEVLVGQPAVSLLSINGCESIGGTNTVVQPVLIDRVCPCAERGCPAVVLQS